MGVIQRAAVLAGVLWASWGGTAQAGNNIWTSPRNGTQWTAKARGMLEDNLIIAAATDRLESSEPARIPVPITYRQVQGPLVELKASPEKGIAPLTVRFTLESGFAGSIVSYRFDSNGDGLVDLTGLTFRGVEITYSQAGVFAPTLIVTDDRGQTVTARTTIRVFDSATIGLLKARWQVFKGALMQGDIEGALQVYSPRVRDRYRGTLQAFGKGLPALAASLGDFSVITVEEGMAESVVTRMVDGQQYLGFIYFALENDGVWRIIEGP